MTTFTFTAFQEQELLQNGDNNLNVGDTIEIPGGASVTFTVQDDDSTLSGDNYTNENANDSTGQTASITEPGGGEVGNGGQIYAESYYWVYDSNGSWFLMLEIEQEGTGEQYYTFHEAYGTPPSGTTLTVHSVCNVSSEWVDYNCLDAGEVPSPGSIAGRYFYDSDGDNTEWNADTNSWEEGVSGKLVFLFDANWNEIARTTTDESGNYSFDGLEPGTHHVMFEGTEGTDFVQPDVGDSGADSDVTWTDQNGTGGVWGVQVHPGQTTWNVDAGIVNTLTDGNEASTVDEDAGVVTLTNVLLNTVDPEAGDPVVYAVWGENGPMTGNVGQPIAGSNGGIFVINADGSITFDTNGAFDNLETGETMTTDIWYCVKDAAGKIVESKYTVTIIGEDEPIVVTAADDFITVFETETAGDLEILDDGSDSVLDNDTQNGVDYTGNVVEVNGVAGQVGQFIDLDGGGRVMINADGTVDFDANGDFDALNDGDTDMVTVDYTIRTQEQADKPQNVLIVIDVSNSTVSLDSGTQNVFDGAGVGDVNGDGRADTVLDAQIVAAQALIDDLRSQGLDSSLVNIGIATFSGVDTTGASSYNDATVDSEVVGTFNLNDAGIDSALAGILSGSWTNYEAGLSEAESWFGANAQAGDGNTMYFLSDGRPVTSYENGAYVEQDTAAFLDELGQIEANYGATIHAVGVGANSSLEVLDQIDNTGGAVQVTDAASLTAALLNTADMDTEQASATVTITVLGENDSVVPLAAVDDFITVMETEGAGDLETLDDGSASILTNDTDGNGPYTGMVVEVAGVSGNVGEWLKLTKGQIMINGDGTVDFDAMGEFEALGNNESDMVQVDYTISRMESTSSSRTITFEEFSRGDVISNQIAGLTIEAQRNGDGTGSPNDAMIFDSVNWSGGDDDLQTTSNGNLLIISEDNDSSDPDDNAGGGKIVIDFDNATQVDELTFVDTEEGGATITLAFEDGTSTSLTGPQTLDGEIGTFTVGIAGVVSMEIALNGSGAIDNLILTESTMAPVVEAEANVFVTINGENVLEDGDESGVTDEETAITLTNLLDNTVDPEAGEPTVISAEGQSTSNGAVTIAGSNGGTFTIASDGTASFDPGTDFLELDDDESLATTATYMVEDAAGDVVTSTVSVVVNGISDPATFELGGTITTQSSASQSLTFIVDYSVATWTTQAGVSQLSADGSAIDLNGDGLLSLIDTVLDNIVASVQDLPADQKVNFIIADAGSTDGIVSTFEVTAGSLQGAANSSSPSMALSAILAAGGDPTDPSTQKFGLAAPGGSTGTGLDIKQALDAAKTYVAANDSDIDEVVVVSSTSTFSLDPNEWIYVGDPRYDPAEDPDGNGFIITPATSADGVVAELAALGATVDVVVINSSDSTVLQPLSTVDADGLDVVSKDNLNGFGLDQLISDPSVIDTGDVIGVKVNGIEYSATDADAAADGFQLELANLPDDPKATGTLLLVDDGTSVNEIDITDDLTQIAGTDRFEFTFDLA